MFVRLTYVMGVRRKPRQDDKEKIGREMGNHVGDEIAAPEIERRQDRDNDPERLLRERLGWP